MIIRCPQCDHSRTINPAKIPASAELATCPKCKQRFRFRTVEMDTKPATEPESAPPSISQIRAAVSPDIWEAVDSLHQRWQGQMDQHVTEVRTPTPQASRQAPQTLPAPRQAGVPQEEHPQAEAPLSKEYSLRTTQALLYPSGTPLPLPITSVPGPRQPRPAAHFAQQSPMTEVEKGCTAPAEHSETSLVAASANSSLERKTRQPRIQANAPVTPTPQTSGNGAAVPHDSGATRIEGVLHIDGATRIDDIAPLGSAARLPDLSLNAVSQASTAPQGETLFLYADGDDTPPEERVERDLQMLRDTEKRPTRDLGKLDEHGTDSQKQNASPVDPIPWEEPSKIGRIRAFMETTKGVMFDTAAMFQRVTSHGSLAHGYLFFVIQGFIAIVCSMLWGHAARGFLQIDTTQTRLALPVLLLVTPLILGMMLIFVTGIIKFMLQVTAPEKADFPTLFKIVSYAAAPLVLSIIPFVGPVAGAAWFVVALIAGCRHALGLNWGMSIAIPFPPALLFLVGMAYLCFF